MTYREAATRTLKKRGPMHYRDLTAAIMADGSVKTSGATPAATLNAIVAVDIHDNFVDLGGESMSAQSCLGGVSLVFGRELPLELLLSEQGTVAGMAAVIDRE